MSKKYETHEFPQSAYPFELQTNVEEIHGDYNIFIPMDIYRNGAVGWRDICGSPDVIQAASGYLSMIQFVGEMMKFVGKSGKPDEHNKRRDSFMYTFKDRNGRTKTVPKVRFLVHLIVKRIRKETGLLTVGEILPDHELYDTKNQIGIMLTILILKPDILLADLIRDLVAENALLKSPDRRPYISSNYKLKVGQTAENENENNIGDSSTANHADDENSRIGDNLTLFQKVTNDESMLNIENSRQKGRRIRAPVAKRQKKKCKKLLKMRRSRIKEVGDLSNGIYKLYEHLDTFYAAAGLIIDLALGKPHIIENREFSEYENLRNLLEDEASEFGLRQALSRERALCNALSCAGMESSSDQLDPTSYYKRKESDSSEIYFCVPIPSLVWELLPEHVSSRKLMNSAFYWKKMGPVGTIVSVVARILNIPKAKVASESGLSVGLCETLGGSSGAKLSQQMMNARHITGLAGIRVPGFPDYHSIDSGLSITMEDDISNILGIICQSSVSSIRSVGKGTTAIKRFVRKFLAENRENERLPEMMQAANGGVFRRVRRYDTNETRPSIMNMDEAIEHLEQKCSEAMAGASNSALAALSSLLDVSSNIPDSVKSCYMFLEKNHDVVQLNYNIHAKNLGIFGQMLTTIMALIKQRGIAVNEWPTLLMMLARDTGYISFQTGLGMHVLLTGKYAGGKSRVMECVHDFSVPLSVIVVNGSSTKGILPTHTPPDKPFGDVALYFDEMPGCISESKGKLSADQQDTASTLASMMTSNKIGYLTNEMRDDKIVRTTLYVETNATINGGANEPKMNKVGKRMVSLYVQPDIKTCPRNATNMMFNPSGANGCDNVKYNAIDEHMRMHHALVLMAAKCIEIDGIPLPCNDKFLVYMQAALEFLQQNYPDIYEAVRAFDIARPLAAICSLWLSVTMIYSPILSGNPPRKYNIYDNRDLVPYLYISEEIIFFVIAFAIHTASVPMAHKVLRWIAESAGGYPFVTYHKKMSSVLQNEKFSVPPRSEIDDIMHSPGRAPAFPNDASSADGSHKIPPFEDVVVALSNLIIGAPQIPIGGSKKTSGAASAFSAEIRGRRRKATTEYENEIIDFLEETGITVNYPLEGNSERREMLRKEGQRTLKYGKPKYYFKKEIVTYPDGSQAICYNPNYLIVNGSLQTFAASFIATNDTKMMTGDVEEILTMLTKKTIPAHILPHTRVKLDDDILLDLEAHRVALWNSSIAKQYQNVPIVIVDKGRWFVLIEALLESPKHIIKRTLNNLCNETTVERDVVLPIPYTKYPHLLYTFKAKPVIGKQLTCSIPSFAGTAEQSMLPGEIRGIIRRNTEMNHSTETIKWDHNREMESLSHFFQDSGLSISPDAYTESALHSHYMTEIKELMATKEGHLTNYPEDALREIKHFDKMSLRTPQNVNHENDIVMLDIDDIAHKKKHEDVIQHKYKKNKC